MKHIKEYINAIIKLGMTQYYIAKCLGVHHQLVRQWIIPIQNANEFYKECIIYLLEITIDEYKIEQELNKTRNVWTERYKQYCQREYKKRILKRYKNFTTTPLYGMLKKGNRTGRPSYSSKELST